MVYALFYGLGEIGRFKTEQEMRNKVSELYMSDKVIYDLGEFSGYYMDEETTESFKEFYFD